MKLEYLDDISDRGRFKDVLTERLIRLYDFDCSQAQSLHKMIQQNIIDEKKSLNLNTIHFIEGLNCELTLVLSDLNEGIVLIDSSRFECKMNLESYNRVVSIIQPFTEELNGFNWLDEFLLEGDDQIDFLFSPGGGW